MKVLRGAGWVLVALVGFAFALSSCGLRAGTPTIPSSGNLERDARRVVDQCVAFDGFIGIWIEGPSSVRVEFRDGRRSVVPCPNR